ncbi:MULTISPECIES: TrkH family potassium uptake protein [Halocynthiibacter]|uniref:Trk system potassium uptake protein n=1 Tax=Halocynthiibacter halioticoli TaxID=2986804 RepID=A0AAE3J0F3_9RHOB|nr:MULTISPECIES: TrkH family potassium uptake protein [Halocynthiibacter]MCV6823861.1 TrkH family potassium uptake protein [Halocynthiibacter halioticoli]MCW4056862.1 TrkH family potassium uptake protein [Halocynthiibacter sp. SDUM655004]MDE0590120.1 TrkH family potassium uptake protein [Halocynthiibacter sp. C4]
MFDLRPVGYVIGLLVTALAFTMLGPMALDMYDGNGHWPVFLESAVITGLTGGLIALACVNGVQRGLSIQQTFLLTTGVWVALPIFGALPFYFGATEARYVDAFFEATSGLTTTGSTVFSGLDQLPRGLLLWRSMLQWFGGVGIIVVAMVFLPELRVGGMQIFRSEAFDTLGKILPRAAEIASRIMAIYVGLTLACFLSYVAVGMTPFDALNHALTTLSTGGFSTHDASFGAFSGPAEYIASVFMILASLPFVRYVQLISGTAMPIWRDTQIRAFLLVIFGLVAILSFYHLFTSTVDNMPFREIVFNTSSILSGTGYASVDYQTWGAFPVVIFFFMGLIGGCAGSTCCSVKIFRYQLLFASIRAQIRKIHSPSGVFMPRYDGRTVGEDVLASVMSFFVFFIVSLGVLAVLLALTGLDFVTSVSGAATAIANVGPGLGDIIGPAGNFGSLDDTPKWLLVGGMLLGRLEIMAVFVIFTVKFWRA